MSEECDKREPLKDTRTHSIHDIEGILEIVNALAQSNSIQELQSGKKDNSDSSTLKLADIGRTVLQAASTLIIAGIIWLISTTTGLNADMHQMKYQLDRHEKDITDIELYLNIQGKQFKGVK